MLLIGELSKLGAANFLLCPSGSALSETEVVGIQQMFTYVKLSPANLLVSAFIKKLAVAESIDIIHLHDPHSHQFTFYSYKLFSNPVPSVVTRRVSFPIKLTSRSYYNHEMIKKVICVSESVKQSLTNLKLSETKLCVLPSGIPLERTESEQTLKEKFGINNGTKIIANLAAVSPQKDYKTFVRAAHHYKSGSTLDVVFLIIGKDDGELAAVQSLIKELDLENQIMIVGYLPNAHKYLGGVDVLLSSSISEGLGNTVMEAMKYKVPIVATNCEGTKDLVKHEESALLADIGDYKQLALSLDKILSDEDLASRLTYSAYNAMQKYDIKETSKQVSELYKTILISTHNI